MKWMKPLLAIISSALILSACSSNTGNNSTPESSANNSKSGDKATLNVVMLGATWGTATQELAKKYEQETGVKVNIELLGRDVIYQKLALSIAGQANYDLFNVDYNWVPEFASTNSLYPLDDLIKKYNVDTSKYLPRALAMAQWDGKNGSFGNGGTIYGLPQTIHPQVLWYRSDLFNNDNIKKEFKSAFGYDLVAPKTMKQFQDASQFFNGKVVDGQKMYGWAAQGSKGFGNVHTWLSFMYSNGADVLNWDKMTSSLSTPQAIEATKTWVDLLKYSPPGINDYTFAEVSSDAAQGKLAMAIHWSWSAFEVDDPSKSKTVGKWDFVQVPEMKQSIPHLGGWANVIPKTSKNPEEAFKFLTWLENQQNDVNQAKMGGGDPVRADSYADTSLTDLKIEGTDVKKFRRYTALQEAMKVAKARPFFPQEEKWESTVSEYLSAAQLKQITVEEALKKADDAVNKMLK
ncbi:sugar ABC transporter substrate-binding protein [Paenibacillus frigoriresistens]|uniref:ABC transporter substrate-binding protein n=1 Tax=Paenibacillus alginolyticus TaxID=59839 RepID=UPI0015654246|nr:sugar ABC transporter substrate-binding protein [Paenibacillus frigoriresistens]NRF92831.1 sugar ABC transporter substrate-binding protein [Paenibacillus frigoriresistens]